MITKIKGHKHWMKEQLALRQKEEPLIKLDTKLFELAYEDGFKQAREKAYALILNLAMLKANSDLMQIALLVKAIGEGTIEEGEENHG